MPNNQFLRSPDAAAQCILTLGAARSKLSQLGPIENAGPLEPKLDHAATIAEAVPHILRSYEALISALAADLQWIEPTASEPARQAVIDCLEALAEAVKDLLPSEDAIRAAHQPGRC